MNRTMMTGSRVYHSKSSTTKTGKQEKSTKKFRTKAPFGVQTKRFASIGFHPSLDPTGALNAYKQKLAPCDYFPKVKRECVAKKTGSIWDRMLKSEEFSKNLGFRNAHILDYRRFMKSMGGPGNYDIPEEIFKKQSSSILKNATFGKQPRFFRRRNQDSNPPPGTYFQDFQKTSTVIKKSFCTLPSFEWDGFIDRFRGLNLNFRQPPNRYHIIDQGSIEMKMKPVSKKKLPYCLFSGVRDGTSIKNHMAPVPTCAPDKYYDWQDGMGLGYLLRHPAKSHNGKFMKATRFLKKPIIKSMQDDIATCYKDPAWPGPAQYSVKAGIQKLPNSLHPFNNSHQIARPGIKWELKPGPGRYNVKFTKCKMFSNKQPTSVFKSTTGRTEYKPPVYTYF